MKKRYTAAMLMMNPKLPIRASHAHAEGEEEQTNGANSSEQPVAQTKVIWKKNGARGEVPAETESGEPNASTEDENVSALPLDEDENISALPLEEDEISALPLDEDETADRPVADEGGETADALPPTPVVVWPEPGEATPGEIALPIPEDEERPVADGEGTYSSLSMTRQSTRRPWRKRWEKTTSA